jgi:AraC family transcriptional regulator, transcriptional activator of pobA
MVNLSKYQDITGLAEPRRLLKYLLIWCHRGRAVLDIDHREYILEEGQALSITSGQIHAFKSMGDAEIYILDFTLDFICKDDYDIELVFHNGLFCHFGQNEIIPVTHTAEFKEALDKIDYELSSKPYQYTVTVRSYILLLLVSLNRAKVDRGDEIWKPDALFLRFLEMIRDHFPENYSVAQFAQALQTTEAKLNEVSKLHTGKTAQNVIYSLLISEAKRLLIYREDLSVKEMAYQLGFNDPFYFSNFFKKHTGLSPKAYKEGLVS